MELEVYRVDDAGGLELIDVEPVPHGKGKACSGIPESALKFDDLEGPGFRILADDDRPDISAAHRHR